MVRFDKPRHVLLWQQSADEQEKIRGNGATWSGAALLSRVIRSHREEFVVHAVTQDLDRRRGHSKLTKVQSVRRAGYQSAIEGGYKQRLEGFLDAPSWLVYCSRLAPK